jgi:hypothetical protein
MDITMMPLEIVVVLKNVEMALEKLFGLGLEPILGHITSKASISAKAGNLLDNSLTKLSAATEMCTYDDLTS